MLGHKNIDKVRIHFCNRTRILLIRLPSETKSIMIFLESIRVGDTQTWEADQSIKKRTVHTDGQSDFFGQYGMYDKGRIVPFTAVVSKVKPLQHQ